MNNTVSVEKINSRWIARCSFEQRAIPKAAGFRWDPTARTWFTTDEQVAAKLLDADGAEKVMSEFAARQEARAQAVVASRQAASDIELPVPDGLSYLPYQRAGIAAAMARVACMIADEMGLGKTIQAIGIINADASIKKILVICPASLKLNWARELRKWLVVERRITVATSQSCHPDFGDITIVNYDILTKHSARLKAVNWDLVIADECHYLKNPKAKRTIAVYGQAEKKGQEFVAPLVGRRAIWLTGTPIPNRPIEGFPAFNYLAEVCASAPGEFKSFWSYAKRYCDAANNGYGWDLTGSSNLAELQEKLRATIMVRRLKADVLKELPAKRRAIIEFEDESHAVTAETEAWERKEEKLLNLRAQAELAKASDNPADYRAAVDALSEAAKAAFNELSKLRHDTAVAKIPFVIEHVTNAIEGGSKVVVFAHHHDVIEALAREFGDAAVVVYGSTAMQQRQDNVDRFQTDPECKVFIGGIQAAGVGLTLTAASHVVFAELDWVPGNVTQAEDRCHRIGQKDMVLVEHLVLEGSLDARMARVLVDKQEVIGQALDAEEERAPVVPVEERERAATESITRAKVEAEAIKLTAAQVSAIAGGLIRLAGLDGDRAREINGIGFSKIDVQIGHSLAAAAGHGLTAKQAVLGAKLIRKYRKQVPEAYAALAIGGE